MKILFYASGDECAQWLLALSEQLPEAQIRVFDESFDTGWQAEYAAVWNPPVSLFEGQQQLRGIINLGAGMDKLLKNTALPESVPLYKLRDAGMANWMTDYVRYGVLHSARDMDRYRQQQSQRRWQPLGIDPKEHWPIGILGLGAIGSAVASALQQDGYPVKGWSRTSKSIAEIETFAGEDELPSMLGSCRVLVNLLPATPTTRKLLDRQRLRQLPQGAILISCGRGEVIDEPALLQSLETGHLRGALLDVFTEEPLPEDNPLWSHPAVIVTPHISAPTPIAEASIQISEVIRQLEQGIEVVAVDRERGY